MMRPGLSISIVDGHARAPPCHCQQRNSPPGNRRPPEAVLPAWLLTRAESRLNGSGRTSSMTGSARPALPARQDLKAKAIGALRRLQKRPGLVRAFFADPATWRYRSPHRPVIGQTYSTHPLVRGSAYAIASMTAGGRRTNRVWSVPPIGADGLAGEDHCQGGAPAAKRGRTTLTVIFARRQDARREEDGPVR